MTKVKITFKKEYYFDYDVESPEFEASLERFREYKGERVPPEELIRHVATCVNQQGPLLKVPNVGFVRTEHFLATNTYLDSGIRLVEYKESTYNDYDDRNQ